LDCQLGRKIKAGYWGLSQIESKVKSKFTSYKKKKKEEG